MKVTITCVRSTAALQHLFAQRRRCGAALRDVWTVWEQLLERARVTELPFAFRRAARLEPLHATETGFYHGMIDHGVLESRRMDAIHLALPPFDSIPFPQV